MNRHTNKIRNNQYLPAARETTEKQGGKSPVFQFRDNRTQAIAQHTLQAMADNSLGARQLRAFQVIADGGSRKVVQRMINKVSVDANGHVQITRDQSRPQGNLRGHTGDHMTPYVSFDHQIIASVIGQTLPDAWSSLLTTYNVIRDMPGYDDSQYKGQFEQLWGELQAQNAKAISTNDLQHYANRILEVRNMLRYTAYSSVGGSTGGQNEAIATELLNEDNRIRKGALPKYAKQAVIKTMWDIFDHIRLNRSVPQNEKAKVLLQHRMSMLDTYWHLVKALNISDADLQKYYDSTY